MSQPSPVIPSPNPSPTGSGSYFALQPNYHHIKKEFVQLFVSGVTHIIFKGFVSLYNTAIDDVAQAAKKRKIVKLDELFQGYLLEIQTSWSESMKKDETERIVRECEYGSSLKTIVDCIIDASVRLFLSGNPNCDVIISRYQNQTSLVSVIYSCYVKSSKELIPVMSYFTSTNNQMNKYMREKLLRSIKKIISENCKIVLANLIPLENVMTEYLLAGFVITKKAGNIPGDNVKFSLIGQDNIDVARKIDSLKVLSELVTYTSDRPSNVRTTIDNPSTLSSIDPSPTMATSATSTATGYGLLDRPVPTTPSLPSATPARTSVEQTIASDIEPTEVSESEKPSPIFPRKKRFPEKPVKQEKKKERIPSPPNSLANLNLIEVYKQDSVVRRAVQNKILNC